MIWLVYVIIIQYLFTTYKSEAYNVQMYFIILTLHGKIRTRTNSKSSISESDRVPLQGEELKSKLVKSDLIS